MSKTNKTFKIEWLGYPGLLGLVGFIWEPLRGFRILLLLCLFFAAPYRKNPRLLFFVIIYALGQAWAFILARGRLPRPDSYAQRTGFILPFKGRWHVESGGVNRSDSHSWHVPNQRYAYDFFIKDDQGRTHAGEGRKLEEYFCFGEPVCAPAGGVVVRANDGIPDNPQLGEVDWKARNPHGNYLVIQHDNGEYSHLAHFKNESLEVSLGDRVEQGQRIGRCGNSGHSTEPHLHFHVQNRAGFFSSLGLPVTFSHVVVFEDGKCRRMERGYLFKGENVMNEEIPRAL
ncbi:MAG: M23 family metallopeptidase [Candidatus Aminicenantes bacterium]|nr:M23 family metallopeptidase [Candidatus Aminicenantes bacterium]